MTWNRDYPLTWNWGCSPRPSARGGRRLCSETQSPPAPASSSLDNTVGEGLKHSE